MIHLPALLLAFGMAASDTTLLTPDSLMVEMKKGGYVVLLRHARTDYSTMDNPNASPTDRSAQRNLSAEGIADARMIGGIFKKFGITFGEVVASPLFRTRETAEMIAGHTDTTMALRTVAAMPDIFRRHGSVCAVPTFHACTSKIFSGVRAIATISATR